MEKELKINPNVFKVWQALRQKANVGQELVMGKFLFIQDIRDWFEDLEEITWLSRETVNTVLKELEELEVLQRANGEIKGYFLDSPEFYKITEEEIKMETPVQAREKIKVGPVSMRVWQGLWDNYQPEGILPKDGAETRKEAKRISGTMTDPIFFIRALEKQAIISRTEDGLTIIKNPSDFDIHIGRLSKRKSKKETKEEVGEAEKVKEAEEAIQAEEQKELLPHRQILDEIEGLIRGWKDDLFQPNLDSCAKELICGLEEKLERLKKFPELLQLISQI